MQASSDATVSEHCMRKRDMANIGGPYQLGPAHEVDPG